MSWGERFFRGGWRGQPWVVVDRNPAAQDEAEFRAILERSKDTDGWVFGFYKDSILHAPTFGVVAPQEIQLRIISALEAYPARRAAEFEESERSAYERAGMPRHILEHETPNPNAELQAELFNSPILTTLEDGRHFLGRSGGLDAVFGALIRHREIPIDFPTAIRILLSCHGDPGAGFEKTPFVAPFHPDEFPRLLARVHGRCPADRRGELLRILARHIPAVVESLRARPPRADRLYSVARRRLATAAARDLWPTRRRRVHEQPREHPDEKLTRELSQLTRQQRDVLDTMLDKAPLQRALVQHVEQRGWSLAWWKETTGKRRTSTLGRTRQEILKKIGFAKKEEVKPAEALAEPALIERA